MGSASDLWWLQPGRTCMLRPRLCIMATNDGKAQEICYSVSLALLVLGRYPVSAISSSLRHSPPLRQDHPAAATRYTCICVSFCYTPPRRCLKATMRLPLIWREISHGSESSSQYLHGLTVRAGHTRWSLGSALFLASWAAIMGPWTYCQHLISTPRLPFTAAYFGSIGLTLYFSLGVSVLPARERRPGSSR